MAEGGNVKAREEYEAAVPPCWKRPTQDDALLVMGYQQYTCHGKVEIIIITFAWNSTSAPLFSLFGELEREREREREREKRKKEGFMCGFLAATVYIKRLSLLDGDG